MHGTAAACTCRHAHYTGMTIMGAILYYSIHTLFHLNITTEIGSSSIMQTDSCKKAFKQLNGLADSGTNFSN